MRHRFKPNFSITRARTILSEQKTVQRGKRKNKIMMSYDENINQIVIKERDKR